MEGCEILEQFLALKKILLRFLTQQVSYLRTGYEGEFRGWGQNDTSWVSPMYWVSKNVFDKVVLSLVAEFQK